jgi:hypothetical protein
LALPTLDAVYELAVLVIALVVVVLVGTGSRPLHYA